MELEIIHLECFPLHCRTCLNIFQDIKHKISELATPILQLLQQSAECKTEELHNESYPDGICQACYEKLNDFNEFQIVCKKSKQIQEGLITAQNVLFSTGLEAIEQDHNKIIEISVVPENVQLIVEPNEENVLQVSIEDLVPLHDEQQVNEHLLESTTTPTKIEHTIAENATKSNICKVCQKSYSSPTALKRHMQNHADERPFSCDICGRGFNAKCQLVRHIEEHSTIEIVCKFNCGEKFDRTYKAEKHYRKNHKGEITAKALKSDISSFICEECGKSFKSRRQLNDHRNSHLPEEQRPYKCNQCSKRFATSSDLRIHVMRHNKTQNFQCSHCGLKKTTARELRLHISNIHTKDRQVRCDICSKLVLNPGCLKRHKDVVHFGYKKFKCEYCDEAFGAADTLKYHERRHTGTKPNTCDTCGRSFIQPYALKKHMNTHRPLHESA